MASYKAKLTEDLDRWIAVGLVPAQSRDAILADVSEPRRMEASSALATVGALLLGIAAIAFVAANWGVIPRLGRFALILGLFLGVSGAASWAAQGDKPQARNVLLMLAGLVYAGAIGLTGQIFDIAGDPRAALHGAGLAAALLAVSGRSSAAGVLALIFVGLGDPKFNFSDDVPMPWLAFAAPVGLVLAWFWRSKALAHAGALGVSIAAFLVLAKITEHKADVWMLLLAASAIFAGLAWGARALGDQHEGVASATHGWWVWAALGYFAAAGLGDHHLTPLVHRGLWLLAAGGTIALGLQDRRGVVTSAGVIALAGAGIAILFDLGLGLMTAAGVFAVVALMSLAGGWMLRRRVRS